MKILYFYLFFILTYCCAAIPAKVEKTQLTFDSFKGVEARGDTVIIYGSGGNMRISYDGAEIWEQVQIFRRSYIIKMFMGEDRIVAFSETEGIAVSYDRAKTWTIVKSPVDSIFSVIQYPEGYLIRSGRKLVTIDKEINTVNTYDLYSRFCDTNPYYYPPSFNFYYSFSTAYLQGRFVVETDSSKLLLFDSELQLKDTIVFAGTDPSKASKFQLGTDSAYLYYAADSAIFRTKDFKSWESICPSMSMFKIIDGQLYVLNLYFNESPQKPFRCNFFRFVEKDSLQLINDSHAEELQVNTPSVTNFTVINNKFYITGLSNFFAGIDFNDSIISNYSKDGFLGFDVPDRINDSTYLMVKSSCGIYYPTIHLTDDSFMSIKPCINYDNTLFSKYSFLCLKYYDEKENKLYIGGSYKGGTKGVYISDDQCRSFTFKEVPEIYSPLWFPSESYTNIAQYPNLQVHDRYFITCNNQDYLDTAYSNILFFDREFNFITKIFYKGFAIDYINAADTNSFLLHGIRSGENTYEVRYTANQCKTWDIIKKYDSTEKNKRYRELEIGNRKYVIFFNFNSADSMYNIDALDVENRTVGRLCQYRWCYDFPYMNDANGACSVGDTLFLSVRDTLFFTTNLYDKQSWNYYILPDKGVIRTSFRKFGDRFFCDYKDSNNRYWNKFWLKITADSTVSVTESGKTEEATYLYIYPPKPTPATNHVRTLIYFDPKVEFDLSKVGVTDVTGARIEGGESISFEKLSPYSGYLNWNCSQTGNGVYFIHIRHGNNARIAKVIVSR